LALAALIVAIVAATVAFLSFAWSIGGRSISIGS
jgi:hypothetical protein